MSGAGRPLRAAAWVALCAALALTGCGGDDTTTSPAAVAPANAPLYAEATVKPDDDDREALDSTLGTLLGEDDPVEAIDRLLDGLFEDEGFTWSRDIEPWAGDRAGIFFLDFNEDSDGALIVDVDDHDAAEEALERIVAEASAGEGDGGSEGDLAQAVTDDHALIGTEAGVQAAVDASTGTALADSDRFEAASEELSDDRLATVYAAPEATLDALVDAGEIGRGERDRIARELGAAIDEPAVLALGTTSEALFAELGGSAEGPAVPSASELIDRVPESAWLALGLGDAGAVLEAALAVAGPPLGDELDRLEASIGLDLTALASGTGDAAGFFGGTSILGIGGAAILEAADGDDLAATLNGLERRLASDPRLRIEPLGGGETGFALMPSGVPIQFPFVLRDDVLVAGLGADAVEQAFEPGSSLADSEPYQRALDGLGDDLETVAYVDFARMRELLEGLSGLADDPDLDAVRPYIDRLDHIVAGVREADGRALLRLTLAVGDVGEGA